MLTDDVLDTVRRFAAAPVGMTLLSRGPGTAVRSAVFGGSADHPSLQLTDLPAGRRRRGGDRTPYRQGLRDGRGFCGRSSSCSWRSGPCPLTTIRPPTCAPLKTIARVALQAERLAWEIAAGDPHAVDGVRGDTPDAPLMDRLGSPRESGRAVKVALSARRRVAARRLRPRERVPAATSLAPWSRTDGRMRPCDCGP